MEDSERIIFDSGGGVTVLLFFVDVANIEKSMVKFLYILLHDIVALAAE